MKYFFLSFCLRIFFYMASNVYHPSLRCLHATVPQFHCNQPQTTSISILGPLPQYIPWSAWQLSHYHFCMQVFFFTVDSKNLGFSPEFSFRCIPSNPYIHRIKIVLLWVLVIWVCIKVFFFLLVFMTTYLPFLRSGESDEMLYGKLLYRNR